MFALSKAPVVSCLLIVATHGWHGGLVLGADHEFIDCSLLVASEYPCNWPAFPFPRFQIIHDRTVGPDSPYNIDVLVMDGNTATQMDVPPHSVARPDLNRPKSGPYGLAYTDKIEPWQFGGEACVVDVQELLDKAPNGTSPLITRKYIEVFEQRHRALKFGDVVLLYSGYSNKYYRPFPMGNRFIADVLNRKAPAFPAPDPDCMEALGERGVLTVGIDSVSMGPLPDLAEPTHFAGLKYGMVWTESAAQFGELPATGAFYCMLGPKHANGPYGASRAFAVVGGKLPERLIASCRAKRDRPFSNTRSQSADNFPRRQCGETSPGLYQGRLFVQRLSRLVASYTPNGQHGRTHLVPPSYALPPGDQPVAYSPEVRGWLIEYERDYGRRGSSTMTTDEVPLEWTCGPARVIDVRNLVGSTRREDWPASPEIKPDHIRRFEQQHGELQPGEIVIFQTGHLDQHYRPQPNDTGVWIDPLAGKSEGWPAVGPDAVVYLHERGIRCIVTDAPDLGGVEPKRALMTYWALGSREMVGVEFLINVDQVPKDGYFLFASVKIGGCHGGPGRAIVLY